MLNEAKIQLVIDELENNPTYYFLPNDVYLPLARRRVKITYEEIVEILEQLCRQGVIRAPSHSERTEHKGPGSYRYFARVDPDDPTLEPHEDNDSDT